MDDHMGPRLREGTLLPLLLVAALVGCDAGEDGGLEMTDAGADSSRPDMGMAQDAGPDADRPPCVFDCPDFLRACSDECPALSDFSIVVPSQGLPPEAVTQNANNNLDVALHEGRIYLAFRTGIYHFADENVALHIVSSEDQVQWDHEATFQMGTDLREPRLLSWGGKLWLYFALLGTNPIDFEPQGMMVSQKMDQGWSDPVWFYEEGFIPWRTKVIDGTPYMITYTGGENIYDLESPDPVRVHWLTTTDGVVWEAVVPPLVWEPAAQIKQVLAAVPEYLESEPQSEQAFEPPEEYLPGTHGVLVLDPSQA